MWNQIIFILMVLSISILGALVVGYYLNLAKLKSRLTRTLYNLHEELDIKAYIMYELLDNFDFGPEYENKMNQSLEMLNNAQNLNEQAAADNEMSDAIEVLFNKIENSNTNKKFLKLVDELKETEELLNDYQDSYNETTHIYNHKTQVFPSKWVASYFGFKKEKYFMVEEFKNGPQHDSGQIHPEKHTSEY